MATAIDVMKGLEIFVRHQPKGDVVAEHDELFAGHEVAPDVLTPAELEALEAAGWHWDEDVEGWSRFT